MGRISKREPFFPVGSKVHWGVTLHRALCGSGWLNQSHDRSQVNCPDCIAIMDADKNWGAE